MTRETKKIKTPGGFEVELKCWLTGRERQQINKILFDGATTDDGKIKLDPDKTVKWQNEGIRQYVVSVKENGKTVEGDILDVVLDLPEADYNVVVAEINKVGAGEEDRLKVSASNMPKS